MVEELEIEVPKLDYLIKKLEGKYGGDFSKEISSRSIVILINGRSIQYGINSYVELRDGDEIAFLYIINGG
jgi:molybdopterin converting factor small subunit